ncbi:MAG: sigma-54-dependent transcriptional regulator [Tepidisphaerales bacterium]
MALFTPAERGFVEALAKLAHGNHFLPERIEFEREALGDDFIEKDLVWSVRPEVGRSRPNMAGERPNVLLLLERSQQLAHAARERLLAGQRPVGKELDLYQDAVIYMLYHQSRDPLIELVTAAPAKPRRFPYYTRLLDELDHYLNLPDLKIEPRYAPAHLLASFYQVHRAFHHIFRHIVGTSMPAARLRGAVWQSIFTKDMRRYLRCLHDQMRNFTTLIVGPSGTGKELVARAVALSRYIPFDPRTQTFAADFHDLFHPLNLSALSPTLIESELFGHRRGAFTGALDDRPGWLEVCGPLGSVFLDEVGEIDAAIQVKLLRVLQTRTFQRLGDTETHHFEGKIMAATNRDLAKEMRERRIRGDFYYRLCSDMIVTPSLEEILKDSPEELRNLVLFIAHRMVARGAGASADEAEQLADEVENWIGRHLGRTYTWPGNFRELEQCVANVLIRGEYNPTDAAAADTRDDLAQAVCTGRLTADQLLRRYCRLVYEQTGSYEETARRLGIDRRTVKAKACS